MQPLSDSYFHSPFDTGHHLSTRWLRALGLIFAACWTIMAVGFLLARADETFFPLFWPFWFLGTAVTTVMAVYAPRYERVVMLAGAMSVISCMSRIGAIWVNLASGQDVYVSTRWRLLVAAAVYAMMAILMAVFWLREVAPWAACERRKRA